jgi:hypothetical protein
MEQGQNVSVWRSGLAQFSYLIPDAGNTVAANWYCAVAATSIPTAVLLSLAVGSGLTLTNVGDELADLQVSVSLTPAQTEALPLGYLYCELWLELLGEPVAVATGTLSVFDSLRGA